MSGSLGGVQTAVGVGTFCRRAVYHCISEHPDKKIEFLADTTFPQIAPRPECTTLYVVACKTFKSSSHGPVMQQVV